MLADELLTFGLGRAVTVIEAVAHVGGDSGWW
jgi:hypothetical protein